MTTKESEPTWAELIEEARRIGLSPEEVRKGIEELKNNGSRKEAKEK